MQWSVPLRSVSESPPVAVVIAPAAEYGVPPGSVFGDGPRRRWQTAHRSALRSRSPPDPCGGSQSKHGLHLLQCTYQTFQRVHVKIALHFHPAPARQHYGQPATRLVFRQRFPDGQFHCHQLAVCWSASRLPLPLPLLQMAIQRAEAQPSALAKLAPPHTAAHKLCHSLPNLSSCPPSPCSYLLFCVHP